jgi:hypothetical protein
LQSPFVLRSVSAWHFGQADIRQWLIFDFLTLPWGGTLLAYILGTHQNETSEILNYIAGIKFPFSITPLAIAPWILFALWKRNLPMIFTICWLAISTQLPLLLAFGTYFIGQHSITSWRHLKQHLQLEHKKIWIHSLPFHLGAWLILALFFALWPMIQSEISPSYNACRKMTEVVASSEDEQKVLRSTRTSNKPFEVSRSEKS